MGVFFEDKFWTLVGMSEVNDRVCSSAYDGVKVTVSWGRAMRGACGY